MGKYLKLFKTHTEYEEFLQTNDFVRPNVSICFIKDDVHYNNVTFAETYLTFVALEDCTFQLTTNAVNYSLDGGETWTELEANTPTPTVEAGNKIMWKGELTSYVPGGVGTFSSTGEFDVEGNAMSLLFGDDFRGKTDISNYDSAFNELFKGNKIINAENLSLPATKLTYRCYKEMFYNCRNLVTAPELPAITLGTECYKGMFQSCVSLEKAPSELPATTLANACYEDMFMSCISLTTAPELPATTLENKCYHQMFVNCSSLEVAPELPATTLANSCYGSMFYGCTNLTTAPSELPATTLADWCYFGMFTDCTSLEIAPELPATTLTTWCYSNMFQGCSSLEAAPSELPATTLASKCYYQMFQGCTSLVMAPAILPATTLASQCYEQMFAACPITAAPVLPATTLVNGCYNNMFTDCQSLTYIKAMFTTEPSDTYTQNWVFHLPLTGTFVKNSAAQWDVTGNNGIPSGWTIETASE